jgi:hypothetical protein
MRELYRAEQEARLFNAFGEGETLQQGLTLVPISAQIELTLPLSAQPKLTLSPT